MCINLIVTVSRSSSWNVEVNYMNFYKCKLACVKRNMSYVEWEQISIKIFNLLHQTIIILKCNTGSYLVLTSTNNNEYTYKQWIKLSTIPYRL